MDLEEANKSGDSSLRDWFSKSKSSDGKPGWVQLGGKYAGKPCAKQPGQTTKPKCGSSKMKRNLNKDEEEAAFRRKNRKDPNPDRKGKAINVNTEETVLEKAGEKDACYHKVKSRYKVWPSAYASGALVKCRKKGAANWGNSTKKEEFSDWRGELFGEGVMPAAIKAGEHRKQQRAAKIRNLTKKGATEGERSAAKGKTKGPDLFGEDCWDGYEKKGMKTMFGKRYPNCVKKKKTKKESVEIEDINGNKFAEVVDVISNEDLGEAKNGGDNDPCWDTHKQVGMKKKGGKMVPNCVPKEETEVTEAVRIPAKTGNLLAVFLTWRGKLYMLKMFFPQVKMPTRSDIQDEIEKVYPGALIRSFNVSEYKPGEQLLQVAEGAAWTKKAGKSESGGLNEKGRKSYERENPGSDLKAPSKKVGNKRRASFCARMKGMKKKLTSSKTANDPDSRINKSLRAWNC